MKNWIKNIIIVVLIIAAAFFVYRKQTEPLKVEYTKLKIENYDVNLLASGLVTADEYINVNPKVSAQILSLPVEIGDSIQKSQLIAKLDSSNTSRDIAAKNAAVEVSQTNLNSLETSKEISQLNLDKLNLQLKKLNQDYERDKNLYENGAIPKSQLDDLDQKKSELEVEIQSAQVTLKSYEENGTEVNKAKGNLNQAQTQLKNAKQTISDYQVLSPVSGIITKVNQNIGEVSNPNTSIVQIAKSNKKIVDIKVDENNIGDVHIGQDIKIFKSNDEENYIIGKIDFISPQVNKDTGTVELKSYISPEHNSKFLFDSDVTVSFLTKTYENAKVLSSKYVVVENDKKYIYLLEDGIAKKTEIETKGFGSEIMVTTKLKDDAIILLPDNLKDGQKVEITKEDKEE